MTWEICQHLTYLACYSQFDQACYPHFRRSMLLLLLRKALSGTSNMHSASQRLPCLRLAERPARNMHPHSGPLVHLLRALVLSLRISDDT